ncbi:hypothetical protein [Pedobacter sp. B4-66]|uniref:hypothetical protein n=1 Tax=Pedobacter sp. B4-66 TaxID=2817280 RepID=UPI001BDB0590|nr:hypothetical protein [Pedobacter sp. B4-66]
MKTVILFLLSLCFLLLGRSDHAYAGAHQNTASYSSALNTEKPQLTKFINTAQDLPVIKSNCFSEQREDFISVENEDEDFVSARKSALPVKYIITLAYASILNSSSNYVKNRLPFCKHFSYTSSYKYILQRVLKI